MTPKKAEPSMFWNDLLSGKTAKWFMEQVSKGLFIGAIVAGVFVGLASKYGGEVRAYMARRDAGTTAAQMRSTAVHAADSVMTRRLSAYSDSLNTVRDTLFAQILVPLIDEVKELRRDVNALRRQQRAASQQLQAQLDSVAAGSEDRLAGIAEVMERLEHDRSAETKLDQLSNTVTQTLKELQDLRARLPKKIKL